MNQAIGTVLLVSSLLGGQVAYADLVPDAGYSAGTAQYMDQIDRSSAAAKAYIDQNRADCEANGGDSCSKIAAANEQISQNSAVRDQLDSMFNSTSTEDAIQQRQQVADAWGKCKQAIYAGMLACQLGTAPTADPQSLAGFSLSGKGVESKAIAPIPDSPLAISGPDPQ